MEVLEAIAAAWQNPMVEKGVLTALSFAGGMYAFHLARKHVIPIAVGLILYPLLKNMRQ